MPETICQILPALEAGGVERGTIEIASALQQAGMPNIVISNGGKLVKTLDSIGVPHITLPVHSKNPIRALWTAIRLHYALKKHHVKIVHVRSRMPAWITKMALIGLPTINFIATYHGTYGIKWAMIKKRYNRVMLSGKKVIAVSNHIKEHLLKHYTITEDKICVIPRGADTSVFNPDIISDADLDSLAQKWGIDRTRPILLLAGRRTRIKGHKLVMEALQKLNNPSVQCLFVGGDKGNTDYTAELEQYISQHHLTNQVKLLDDCTNMPLAYALCDIMISATTKPESFGRTVPEAQLMGAIVVAANHGGTAETIQDYVTGFHFTPNDSDSLAVALKQALSLSNNEKTTIRLRAKKEVQSNYTTENMCQKTLDVYRSLLNK